MKMGIMKKCGDNLLHHRVKKIIDEIYVYLKKGLKINKKRIRSLQSFIVICNTATTTRARNQDFLWLRGMGRRGGGGGGV